MKTENRTTMRLIEKVFALEAVFPFSLLKPEELLTIATAATDHRFSPGRVLCARGDVLNRLYVRIGGNAVDDHGNAMQAVLGTTMLLTSKPAPFTISTGPDGYLALAIPRGKFFTIVNECPALLVGFFRMPLLRVDYGSTAAPVP
ncbi:MAG TPA: hypothetical protein VK785_02640 [Opitutaceae bacterium]|nr:hypothetical protein [Opitutaceae bacterium]